MKTKKKQGGVVLVIDASNSFTKMALHQGGELVRVSRHPTPAWTKATWLQQLERYGSPERILIASVVPRFSQLAQGTTKRVQFLTAKSPLGLLVDYPQPKQIGADRLANAAAAVMLHPLPAIVLDMGTAVTFDIIDDRPAYVGGVIAPGMKAMTDYLHEKTALLPKISLRPVKSVIGKSTIHAMRAGAFTGYRGMISEILAEIRKEIDPSGDKGVSVILTGGDAGIVAGRIDQVTTVDTLLTLRGLGMVADRLWPEG